MAKSSRERVKWPQSRERRDPPERTWSGPPSGQQTVSVTATGGAGTPAACVSTSSLAFQLRHAQQSDARPLAIAAEPVTAIRCSTNPGCGADREDPGTMLSLEKVPMHG